MAHTKLCFQPISLQCLLFTAAIYLSLISSHGTLARHILSLRFASDSTTDTNSDHSSDLATILTTAHQLELLNQKPDSAEAARQRGLQLGNNNNSVASITKSRTCLRPKFKISELSCVQATVENACKESTDQMIDEMRDSEPILMSDFRKTFKTKINILLKYERAIYEAEMGQCSNMGMPSTEQPDLTENQDVLTQMYVMLARHSAHVRLMLESQRALHASDVNTRECTQELRQLSHSDSFSLEEIGCHSQELRKHYETLSRDLSDTVCYFEKLSKYLDIDLNVEQARTQILSEQVDNKCDCSGVQLRDCLEIKRGIDNLEFINNYFIQL